MTTATPFEPGRIVMLAFPYTDATANKLRPALVVSGRDFNVGEDFVAVPISTRLEQNGFQILSSCPYFPQTKLRTDSTVKWNKPATFSQKIVIRQLGTVPNDVLFTIRTHIRELFD